jgi:RepB plasmid partitioning protein/ParB-like nuclease domain
MTQPPVKISFRQEVVELPLERLDPLKDVERKAIASKTYKQLKASLEHVGLIEPLAVYPRSDDKFVVVNGNLRLHILRQIGVKTARCTIALDDESYTYNRRVNPLSPITEHFMILKAIANGVTEQRIAAALNIDVKAIVQKRNLLDGICPEAVDLLKDKRANSRTFQCLRKMKPLRQIEAAELMVAGKNYSASFAESILSVTNPEQLVKPEKEGSKPADDESGSILEDAQDHVAGNLAAARKTYGADVLALAVVCRNLETLLANREIKKYLSINHAEVLRELKKLIEAVSSERGDSCKETPTDKAWPVLKKLKAVAG